MMSVLRCSYAQDSVNFKNDAQGYLRVCFLMGKESQFCRSVRFQIIFWLRLMSQCSFIGVLNHFALSQILIRLKTLRKRTYFYRFIEKLHFLRPSFLMHLSLM